MTTNCRAFLCTALLLVGGCAGGEAGFEQLPLPNSLREISGLAVGPDGNLLAIADERGDIFSIEFAAARIKRVPGFGDPSVKGDFEGLAILDGVLYATTSDGDLYSRAVDDADPNAFDRVETDLGKRCEIEGLEGSGETLWFLCKKARKKKYRDNLVAFAWSTETTSLNPDRDIVASFSSLGFGRDIAPSGLSFNDDESELWIVAAQDKVFAVVTPDGAPIRVGMLPDRQWHPQTEGIAIIGSSVYLADEGGGKKGTLSRYVNGF